MKQIVNFNFGSLPFPLLAFFDSNAVFFFAAFTACRERDVPLRVLFRWPMVLASKVLRV